MDHSTQCQFARILRLFHYQIKAGLLWYKLCQWLKRFAGLFAQCDLCLQDCSQHSLICNNCREDFWSFPVTQARKVIDLLSLPLINRLFQKAYFDQLYCLGVYRSPLNRWLTQLKYQGKISRAALLSELFNQRLGSTFCDSGQLRGFTLVPVPCTAKKRKQRLFNQTEVLALPIAQNIGLDYQENLLIRLKHAKAQVGQSGAQRRANLKNAYDIAPDVTSLPAKIALFDDVITTGTTVNEIARLLKRCGVGQVVVIALAISLNEGQIKKLGL